MNIMLLICRPLEQVAMDKLVELAHRKQLVCCLSPLFIPNRAEFTKFEFVTGNLPCLFLNTEEFATTLSL